MSLKLLIAEDSSNLRLLYRINLEYSRHDYKILEAGTIEEAEKIFRDEKPDVVISDFRFDSGNPDAKTGKDLCDYVREHSDTYVPFILISGKERPEVGFDHFIFKEDSPEQTLVEVVDRIADNMCPPLEGQPYQTIKV